VGFRFDTQAGPRTAYLLLEDRENRALDARARRLLDLLQLDPKARSFPIRFGFGADRTEEIRIYTSSLIEILGTLAGQIEVPAGNVTAGRTYPTQARPAALGGLPSLAVSARELRPYQSFVAVAYRATWYWIDDRDYASKRVFSTLMLPFNLVEGRRSAAAGDHDPDGLKPAAGARVRPTRGALPSRDRKSPERPQTSSSSTNLAFS
jgi:hypothetical protein